MDSILIFLRLELLADKAQFNSLFAACVFLWHKNFLRQFLRAHYFWAVLYVPTVLKSCKVKSCTLDPVPASVLTGCLPVLLTVITDLVNCSLDTVFMPVALKTALIIPLLKKSSLYSDDFKNFCLVSNLPFLPKVIEKVVAVQLLNNIDDNNLGELLQSAYKRHHGMESALLKVYNDILKDVDNQQTVVLLLLDLSAYG